MANIIEIFHKDILPTDLAAEYEMTGLGHTNSQILLYRRGLIPLLTPVHTGMRVNIPLLPIDGPFSSAYYKTNADLKREIKKFIVDSIPFLRTQDMKIKDAVKLADSIFTSQGTYLRHVLHSTDLANRIGPIYDYISAERCIDIGRGAKNALIFLPEEVFTGIISLKDSSVDSYRSVTGYTNSRGRFGIMLSKENALMCDAI